MALSRSKKLLFSLLPAALLLLIIVAAEFGLRAFSPSHENDLASEVTYDGIEWYQVNRGYLKKYFPANTPLIPEFKTSLFKRHKDSRSFRIMCLGESSMFGTPYDMNANIPGIVRTQLRHLHPDKEIEVINWAASAINSNVLLDLSRRILIYEPDLVLIYLGHNEFYGPDGVGASAIERLFPFMTQVKYRMRELRLVQAFQSYFRGAAKQQPDHGEMNLMRQVSEGSLVRPGSSDALRVFTMFERNLNGILELFSQQHVPVVISDISSNLLFPPFVSDSVLGESQYSSIASARIASEEGRYNDAMTQLGDLYSHDSTNALVNFWLGRTLVALSRQAEARSYLERARDNDLLKFRAPGQINRIIRAVSGREGTTLISADSVLAAACAGNIPGDLVFWEHLHPTAYGYYLIADNFVNKIENLGLILSPQSVAPKTLLPFDLDSLGVCWLELAYADRSIQHLTGRWPFEEYKRTPAVLNGADNTQRGLIEEVYGRVLGWDEGCYRSAMYFWRNGRHREAMTTYRALLEEYPYNFYANYLLGSLLNNMGNPTASIDYYRRSIQSNPQYPKSRLDLGLIEVNQGNFNEAISQLTTALQIIGEPGPKEDRATALYGLAAAYANMSDFAKANLYIDGSLALVPNNPSALKLRASIPRSRGK